MTISFAKLLTDCLVAAGDSEAVTWPRASTVATWAKESMQVFPILRPMLDDHTNGASVVYSYQMPTDFREVISVEYPISQQPPQYLARKNRLDPDFYNDDGFYDIDYDYATGNGYTLYVSGGVAASAHIKLQYLAAHATDLTDTEGSKITVPDQYENILIAYFICKAWRERLGKFMLDPTAHTSLISQMTDMVRKAEQNYQDLVTSALQFISESKVSPRNQVDKFDRVY